MDGHYIPQYTLIATVLLQTNQYKNYFLIRLCDRGLKGMAGR
jgi:hypothetical protein